MRTGKNVVYQELEGNLIKVQAELPSQEAKATALRGQVAQLDAEIRSLDLREKELDTLKREFTVSERNYKTYLEKAEEARILEDLNRQKSANITVIQEATVPVTPIKPKKLLNIALGLILGAVSGLGLAFFCRVHLAGHVNPRGSGAPPRRPGPGNDRSQTMINHRLHRLHRTDTAHVSEMEQ